jgi:exodeoxyribonuclease VII small subunit
MANAKKNKRTFEEAIRELESIIARLEGDDLTLDDALQFFEQGVGLMRTCDTHLKGAEGKLRELLKGENGEFIEKLLGPAIDAIAGGEDIND